MTQSTSTYKMDPAPVFLFAYVTGSLCCAAFVVALALFDPEFQQTKLSAVLETIGYIIVFFGPPYAALCALVMTHYFKYRVTSEGIRGQNFLGKSQFVAWSDIHEFRPICIGNLDFARLIGKRGERPIWLPLFVKDGGVPENAFLQWTPQGLAGAAFSTVSQEAVRVTETSV